MKRIPWSPHWPDAFVFDDAYVLDVSDDAMSISQFDSRDLSKPVGTNPNIRSCPKIEIEAFGKHTLRGLIKLGQFGITLKSPKAGIVKHNDNYSVAADGAYWRRIRLVNLVGRLTKTTLVLSISVNADPVETLVSSQPPGSLSSSDKKPFVFEHDFVIPLDSVADLIDLDRTQRQRFRTLVESMKL
jgi:hypothetical protein